jgi:hypothetical protein
MRALVLVTALGFAGCAAQPLTHSTRAIDVDAAHAIIEQVVMEQPTKHRPGGVTFADAYIAIHKGYVTRGRGTAIPVGNLAYASGSSVSREQNTLLYFDTIATTRIHTKRDWYVLDVVDGEGRILQRVYCRDEAKARRFVDAVSALKART